jgi:chromosome segregation ATPase
VAVNEDDSGWRDWQNFHDRDPSMKFSHHLFGDAPNPAGKKPGGANPLIDRLTNSGRTNVPRRADTFVDAEGRHWPKHLPSPKSREAAPQIREPAPENREVPRDGKASDQSVELVLRCIQVADLYNKLQEHTAELTDAHQEIDDLRASITDLQDTITQQETEAAAAKQSLDHSNQEKVALQEQLDQAKGETAELLQRLLKAETALNDGDIAVVSAQEKVEPLTADLNAKTTELAELKDRLDELNKRLEEDAQRHRDELSRQRTQFEDKISELETLAAQREAQAKDAEVARAAFAEQCGDLAKTVDALAGEQQYTQKKRDTQEALVQTLEALLRAEREAAEFKLREVTAELQRERQERSAAETASAAMRNDLVLLLPKLAARGFRLEAIEGGAAMPRSDAA